MMRKPILGMAVLVLLAACDRSSSDQAAASNSEGRSETAANDDSTIECAAAGSADFARDCTVARTETDRGLMLTVSHPDGHFRRLLVTKDGRGVIAADGAQPAKVAVLGVDRIEVTIAGDRYRLPAHTGRATP